MKKITLIIALVVTLVTATAATYTVEQVPNVHVADRTQYVSNPDGILSDQAVATINSTLKQVWDSTSAEVVVVAISDIESSTDIDRFANDLFTSWGIGKKDKDNGLLVLIVKDQHQAVIRTGYGMEGTVPDILCGNVIRHAMAPRFRDEDYDGGTIDAVNQLASVITSPEARDELMSKYANDEDVDAKDFFLFYLIFATILTIWQMISLIYNVIKTRKLERYDRYKCMEKLNIPMLVVTFIGLGLPLIAYVPLRWYMHHLRRSKRCCPNCGTVMTLVDEEHDNLYLTPAQDTEEQIRSVDYDVWLCPQCGETDILPYRSQTTSYTECPICHSVACVLRADRIILQPTTEHEGYGIKDYNCINCHTQSQVKYTIAKLATPPIVIVGGGHGIGGGGISGGSFGGGMTGGGGAHGGW